MGVMASCRRKVCLGVCGNAKAEGKEEETIKKEEGRQRHRRKGGKDVQTRGAE